MKQQQCRNTFNKHEVKEVKKENQFETYKKATNSMRSNDNSSKAE